MLSFGGKKLFINLKVEKMYQRYKDIFSVRLMTWMVWLIPVLKLNRGLKSFCRRESRRWGSTSGAQDRLGAGVMITSFFCPYKRFSQGYKCIN